MSVNWTDEQREAVYAPVSNILVTAAAGAGKTQVLTGRILQRILDGADVTKMLVVTFTNAAAAEMRGRIASALSDYLAEHPENEHVRTQLMYLPSASIQTIHSFCLDMIKNNFFRLSLKPDFKICEGGERKMIFAEAMEEMLAQLYEEGKEEFLSFADSFSTVYGDDNICEMVEKLYNFSESMPHPEKWLSELSDIYENISEENFEESYVAKIIREHVNRKIEREKYTLLCARNMCTQQNGLEKLYELLSGDIDVLDGLLGEKSWNGFSEAAKDIKFATRRKIKDCDEQVQEAVANIRDGVKDEVHKKILPIMMYNVEENVFLMKNCRKNIAGLVEATLCFKRIFSKMKEEKNLLDFGDIEHYCIKLLGDEEIVAERKNFYEEIYVDEYQDSNAAQEYIFKKISGWDIGKPNLFMVGDVKQSIYGFRQTSPKLFTEKKDTYKFGDDKNRKIVLGKNFRSSENVIDFINIVCEKIMCRETGGVDYNEEERLCFQAAYPKIEKNAEIDVLYSGEKMTASDKVQAEVRFMAKRICQLMKGKVYDLKKKEERSIRYGDIAILMRSVKDSAREIEEVFGEYGIPVFVDSEASFFDSPESKTILSLLTIIDNPVNDIPLISVMRSPVGKFTERELVQIKIVNKKEDFYFALKEKSSQEDDLGEKCRDFLDMLDRLRTYAEYMPVNRLIEKAISETGYFETVCAMPGGEVRAENIRQLVESARKYENASYRGLYNFITYVNGLKNTAGKMGEAKAPSEGLNAVRVMSIHKSKGLEFPVVFLARCGKDMNRKNQSGMLILHSDCGAGLKYADPDRKIIFETPLRQATKLSISADEISEEIRVLYVALTRAKEQLIMVGSVDDKDKTEEKSEISARLMGEGQFIEGKNYLEYLLAVEKYCRERGEGGINLNFICAEEDEGREEEKEEKIHTDYSETDWVRENLSFEYNGGHLWEIPSKLTVTELKRLWDEQEIDTQRLYKDIDIKIPLFMEEEKKSGARCGQLVHFVMQNIDFSIKSVEEVDKFVNSLREKNILSSSDADAVDTEKIARFLESELCEKIRNADKVYREEPFAMTVPASMITGKSEDFSEKIMVQGIIDCYFISGENIYLLDYKTDKNTDREYIVNNYKKQLDIYALALEKKYFRKIFKKFIYLFNNNDIIEI